MVKIMHDKYTNKDDSHWFNNNVLQELLDKETHSQAYGGNKITLLVNGIASSKRRKINLAEADIILIKAFEFLDDSSSNDLVELLQKKAFQGSKIFIQFDVKGTRNDAKLQYQILKGVINPIPEHLRKLAESAENNVFLIPTSIPQNFLDYLRYKFKIYYPLDHEKYFITWNAKNNGPIKVIMGGMNIADEYMLGGMKDSDGRFKTLAKNHDYGFRDTDIELIGPAAKDIIAEYVKSAEFHLHNNNFYYKKHLKKQVTLAINELKIIRDEIATQRSSAFPKNAGKALVRFVCDKPISNRTKRAFNIQNTFSILLKYVPLKKVIVFETAFFFPTACLKSQIIQAAKRGVEFNFLLNASDAIDNTIASLAKVVRSQYRFYLNPSMNDSIKIFDWHGSDNLGVSSIHHKIYSFGEQEQDPFIIGSANFDRVSTTKNAESFLIIQDTDSKNQFNAMLTVDFSQPKVTRVTRHELKKDSFSENFKRNILIFFYKMFTR